MEKKHPETIGTISFCGENSYIIEEEKQIMEGINLLKKSNIKKLLIIVQTTFSLEKFNKFLEIIKENVGEDIKIDVKIQYVMQRK